MGGITEMGYRFGWKGARCWLCDEQGKEVAVTINQNCPMVSKEVGRELINKLEIRQLKVAMKTMLVNALFADPKSMGAADMKNDIELALTVKLKALFPALPDEILMRVIPEMAYVQDGIDGSRLPWNRRKRRNIANAKQVVVHLFSGPDQRFWEKKLSGNGVEVLCVDLNAQVPADLHDDNVFRYLLMLAASGRVKTLLGGPPCRTVSALRYQNDGGPGVLRSEEHPYGLPTLKEAEQELVVGDSVLLFRMLAMYMVCEDVRFPDEPQTGLAIEQPEDPARYRPHAEVEEKKFMSIWRTREWQDFATTYQIKMLHFDQGPMGHTKRKPTTLAVVLRDIQVLNGVRGPPSGVQPEGQVPDRNDMTLQERCEESRSWSAWAPGLKVALVLAIQDRLHRGTAPSLEAALRPLGQVALESWRAHYLNDHMPARRDCKHCVKASARSKPHKRVSHAEAYTLSVDLSGKMVAGHDQSRHECRYMMVAVYTFPVDKAGNPLAELPNSRPLDVPEKADPSSFNVDADEYTPSEPPDDPGDVVMLEAEEARGLGEELTETAEAAEDECVGGVTEAGVRKGQEEFEAWHKAVEEEQEVKVRNLTFVEVLPGRAVTHILPALARIYARLRSLGLPVYRIHCDRARELISAPVRRWTLDRGIVTTLTSGDSFKSNGRVEGELGVIKKHVRTVVAALGKGLEFWPLAAIHIGERGLRGQLRSLGCPVGPLLHFGARAFALKKSWQDRYQPWREIRDEVLVLGPAIQSSLTTTSYYVQSVETQRYFYTDDVVVPNADQPESAEALVHLPELPDSPVRGFWEGGVPRRRLREKTAIPQLSMLHMEGEDWVQKWLCLHRDQFDHPAPQDALRLEGEVSSDSWTIETPDRSSSSERASQSASDSMEEDSTGGGEWAEAPNNQDGGSRLVASLKKVALGNAPLTKVGFVRKIQANLAEYVGEEMQHVDVTNHEQGCYMEVLTEAIMHKVEAEEILLKADQEGLEMDQKELEEEFLVTRTVGNKEVMDDFENWVPSITAEYSQLVETKEAVEQISKRELHHRAEKQQKTIELLPAKMVYTRKAGTGQRRARAVVCGNYSDTRFSSDCYAGGADGCQVRALLRTSALKGWSLAATDIRVAFLNAPRRDDGKLVAMEIPNVYKRLGLAKEGEVWLVKLAMYGLTTSPRDWSKHRDLTLPSLSWVRVRGDRNVRGYFVKTADDNLWRLEETDTISGEEVWSGLMSVYVDDILMSGEEEAIAAALTTLQSTWATSSVEWASPTTPVHFCGFEVTMDEEGDGYHISQQKYEQELLARWKVSSSLSFPHFKLGEADCEQQPEVDINKVREAQALAGSLLRLSTRSRPDLSYGVAAVSRLVTRNPVKAIEVAHVLLAYIKGNPGDLHYARWVKQKWGARGQLKVARHEKLLEVFADIAYGSGTGHRSVQGLVVSLAGAPVAWQSSTQPFVTHSTAESELVSYCEGLTAGRATEALWCAMWGEELNAKNTLERVLYGDNAAAIGLAHGNSTSSWRTRHLRVRSHLLHEALDGQSSYPGGPWKLHHLRGTELVADGMTKPLAGQSFAGFLEDLGLKAGEVKMNKAALGGQPHELPDQQGALRALVVGGLLIKAAEAQGETTQNTQEASSTVDALWMCGIVLVIIGAIWVMKTMCGAVSCCIRRLCVKSGEHTEEGEESESEKVSTPSSMRPPSVRRTPTRMMGYVGEEGASETEGGVEEERSAESEALKGPRSQGGGRSESTMTRRSSMTRVLKWQGSAGQSAAHETLRQRSTRTPEGPSSSSSSAVQAVTEEAERAARSAWRAALAADRAAENVEAASELLQRAAEKPVSMNSQTAEKVPANPWNRFQKKHASKGWSMDRMRAEYYKSKCSTSSAGISMP